MVREGKLFFHSVNSKQKIDKLSEFRPILLIGCIYKVMKRYLRFSKFFWYIFEMGEKSFSHLQYMDDTLLIIGEKIGKCEDHKEKSDDVWEDFGLKSQLSEELHNWHKHMPLLDPRINQCPKV